MHLKSDSQYTVEWQVKDTADLLRVKMSMSRACVATYEVGFQ